MKYRIEVSQEANDECGIVGLHRGWGSGYVVDTWYQYLGGQPYLSRNPPYVYEGDGSPELVGLIRAYAAGAKELRAYVMLLQERYPDAGIERLEEEVRVV